MNSVIVYNDEERVICVHYTLKSAEPKEGDKPMTAVQIQAMIKNTQHFDIMPGNNEIPKNVWDIISEDSEIKTRLENESLRVVMDDSKKGITGIGVKNALAIIADTFDVKLLKQWRQGEKREAVQDAIDKQIESMAIKKAKE